MRIAINGFGRIGRNILRAWLENDSYHNIDIVAINDMANIDTLVHLLKYDSISGRFPYEISVANNEISINNRTIQIVCERNPSELPWKTFAIDIVYECTGLFTDPNKARAHIEAGAKKVLISAPSANADATIVFGVNHHVLKATDTIVSNASCTTNCLAPLIKPLHDQFGVDKGLMTTIHAYTNDQHTQDAPHKDMRRARAAALSMIPTKTGAAKAVGLVLPELNGRLDGFAVRVPTANVSLVDLTFIAKKIPTRDEVNQILIDAAKGSLKGVLDYTEEPLVSIDFCHQSASSIVDLSLTKVIDNMVKVSSWYDNEWGFSNRMLDTSLIMMSLENS